MGGGYKEKLPVQIDLFPPVYPHLFFLAFVRWSQFVLREFTFQQVDTFDYAQRTSDRHRPHLRAKSKCAQRCQEAAQQTITEDS